MMEENKRTTAPVSSVAADVGQSQINDSTIISDKQQKDNLYTEKNTEDMQQLVRKMQQMQNPNYLHMIGIEDLMDMTFQVRQTVIENLLHKRGIPLCRSTKNRKILPSPSNCLCS